MPSADPGLLSDVDWERHQRIIAAFETSWKRGEGPRIDDHLPGDEPRPEPLLLELVHADLEFRIKAGEPARVEDYLRRYPGLGRDRDAVLGLIRAEYALRRRDEPGLGMGRYRRRFPEYLAELGAPRAEASTVTATPEGGGKGPKGRARAKEAAGAGPGPAAEPPLPRPFGKFELREKLGLGSFGVVYRAWDTVLRRDVAIKVPRPEVAAAKHELQAFLREARNAIGLQHPNIVAILDAGPIEGVDCLVRAYIEGMTLDQRLRQGPLTPEEIASLMSVVADAVDYANRHGIIHRDLKPSNILLDLRGRPHVSDFGLAKRDSSDTTLSPSGSHSLMIGTPAYMSPEQARGETYIVDARSDVYSLGVVLYELLAGSLPFRGRGKILQIQIQEARPLPPRSLNDEIPDDLQAVCLKALAKEPLDRYQAAKEMADDLRNFLKGEPIGAEQGPDARPAPGARRASGRGLAWLSAGLALSLAVATTTALWRRAEALRARDAEGLERAYRALLGLGGPGEGGGHGDERAGRLAGTSARAFLLAEGLATTLEGDPGLVELAADARMGLAGRASEEGPDEVAGPRWARAVAACEASLRHRPDRHARLVDLGLALARLAEVRGRAGDRAGSRELFDRSLSALSGAGAGLERRASLDPGDADVRLGRAEILLRVDEVRKAAGESPAILDIDAIARELLELSWSGPPAFQRRLALAMLDASRRQLDEGHVRPAEDSASAAFRLGNAAGPGSLAARACLAMARANRDLGRPGEAAELYADAVRRFEESARLDQGRPEDRRELGVALFESGRLLERRADFAGAIACHRGSLRVRLELDRSYPGAHATLAGLAEARSALAGDLEAEGRLLPSIGQRLGALRDRARAARLAPGEASYRRLLANAAGELARGLRIDRLAGPP